jgi:hypothetical protein
MDHGLKVCIVSTDLSLTSGLSCDQHHMFAGPNRRHDAALSAIAWPCRSTIPASTPRISGGRRPRQSAIHAYARHSPVVQRWWPTCGLVAAMGEPRAASSSTALSDVRSSERAARWPSTRHWCRSDPDHRRSGSLQRGHARTLERLVLWSTPPTRCPSTGIGRRRRRIRRLHERIPSVARKNNATNDFQHELAISKPL